MTANPRPIGSMQEHFSRIASGYEACTGGSTRIVAQYLAQIMSPMNLGVKVLDIACGPGVVIDELLNTASDSSARDALLITAVDISPAMIDIVKHKVENSWKLPSSQVKTHVLAAEDLDTIGSDEFDISITNFGLQFFKDAGKGAAHIGRTLKTGGTAYVTAWHDLGWWKAVQTAANEIGPHHPPPRLPYDIAWFEAEHLKGVLKRSGFADVSVQEIESQFSSPSTLKMAETLVGMIRPSLQEWTEEEIARLPEALRRALENGVETLVKDEQGAHVKMIANVAVCSK